MCSGHIVYSLLVYTRGGVGGRGSDLHSFRDFIKHFFRSTLQYNIVVHIHIHIHKVFISL